MILFGIRKFLWKYPYLFSVFFVTEFQLRIIYFGETSFIGTLIFVCLGVVWWNQRNIYFWFIPILTASDIFFDNGLTYKVLILFVYLSLSSIQSVSENSKSLWYALHLIWFSCVWMIWKLRKNMIFNNNARIVATTIGYN